MNDIMIAAKIGELAGIFLLTLIVYKIIQYLILRNKKSPLMIVMRFIISTAIVVPFVGYGEYNYVKPFYIHMPFIIAYMIIDLIVAKTQENKELKETINSWNKYLKH